MLEQIRFYVAQAAFPAESFSGLWSLYRGEEQLHPYTIHFITSRYTSSKLIRVKLYPFANKHRCIRLDRKGSRLQERYCSG
eukprot:SAG11_NODE_996_length_6253_cov_3.652909_4_plen_81_part_00